MSNNTPTPPHPTAPARGEGETCPCSESPRVAYCSECGRSDGPTNAVPTPTGAGEAVDGESDVEMACRITADVVADGRLRLDRPRLAQLLRDATTALHSARAEAARLGRELSEISAAIGTCEYMDPPDGGDVSLAEQVRRMRGEIKRQDDELEYMRRIYRHADESHVSAVAQLDEARSTLAARDAELAGVREAAQRIAEVAGCGDHSCLFKRPTGMGTNGGCRCARSGIVMGRLALLYRAATREGK